MESAYHVWRGFLDRVVAPVASILLLAMTLLALVEVGRRYIFGQSYEWQQDAVTFFTLAGVFLYFSVAQATRSHLSVTVVPELLAVAGPRAKAAGELVKLLALGFSMVFLITVVWWGLPEVEDSLKYEVRTESLAFPLWPFLASLLLGFALMAVTMVFQFYFGIQKLRGRPVPEEPSEEEGGH